MKHRALALAICALALTAAPAAAVQLKGVVSGVVDGDTVRVKFDEGQTLPAQFGTCSKVYKTMAWIKQTAIVCPNPAAKQFCAAEAKSYAAKVARGNAVTVDVTDCASQGGLKGLITLNEGPLAGKILGLEMVRGGMARTTREGLSSRLKDEFQAAQRDAMVSRRGLWGAKPCRMP
ncbi:MAG: thermonuclease family protein [Nitrospinae bacterium]|nr:thermonuclease family protein [Nitrospinota bacterium]